MVKGRCTRQMTLWLDFGISPEGFMRSRVRVFAAVLVISLLFILTGCDGGAKKLIVGTWVPAPASSTEFMGSVSKSTWWENCIFDKTHLESATGSGRAVGAFRDKGTHCRFGRPDCRVR